MRLSIIGYFSFTLQAFIVPGGLIIGSNFVRQYNGLIVILVNDIPHSGDSEIFVR